MLLNYRFFETLFFLQWTNKHNIFQPQYLGTCWFNFQCYKKCEILEHEKLFGRANHLFSTFSNVRLCISKWAFRFVTFCDPFRFNFLNLFSYCDPNPNGCGNSKLFRNANFNHFNERYTTRGGEIPDRRICQTCHTTQSEAETNRSMCGD